MESLDRHLDGISGKAVSIRGGMKKAEKRIRAIDTMLSYIDSYEKNKASPCGICRHRLEEEKGEICGEPPGGTGRLQCCRPLF